MNNLRRLAWGNVVDAAFRSGVYELCESFKWQERHAEYLMACMAFETGETFSPSVVNAAGSGATGLIQFMPITARGLGTTVQALAAMTAVQQLEYVKKYFAPYYKKVDTLADMYMSILMPKYVGASESVAIFSGGTAYRQNSGLDADKDGLITKREAAAKVQAKLVRGLTAGRVWFADS